MLWHILFLVGGGFAVWLGAEGMVRGSVKLAAYLGIPPLIIGLTVVAFGTSTPELVVSTIASVHGHSGIAFGNVIGSNIINIALVLGISALIAPLVVSKEVLRRDIPIMVLVTLAVVGMAVLGDAVGRLDGVILLAIFVGYTIFSYKLAVREQRRMTMDPGWERSDLRARDVLFLIGGLIILSAGAEGMVRGATAIAEALGVSERIIGMTIVAFGTSLPELAASVVAAKNGESDLALGNVVGSNLFNMTLILGVSATVAPIPTSIGWSSIDMIFFVVTVLMLVPLVRVGWRLGRVDGAILLGTYALSLGLILA